MVGKSDDPTRLRIRAAAIAIPLACSTEIIPRALVKEKCVSAFEFNRIMPRPSSRPGGSTIAKTAAHSSFNLLDSRGFPTSANFAISVRCGFSASERLPADIVRSDRSNERARHGERRQPTKTEVGAAFCSDLSEDRGGLDWHGRRY